MKIYACTIIILISIHALAAQDSKQKPQPAPKTEAKKMKMTMTEAKELCKKEGKEGEDLIQCIEEKQNK